MHDFPPTHDQHTANHQTAQRPLRPKGGRGHGALRHQTRPRPGRLHPQTEEARTRNGQRPRSGHGLWSSGIHEARILAGMVEDPNSVTETQMEEWVSEFDSWGLCDQVCMNLFRLTPFAYAKCFE